MADGSALPQGSPPNPLDVVAIARIAARKHGYALAIHGSMARDLDLIAVPWAATATEPAVLVEAIRKAVGGWIMVAEPDGREGYYGIDDESKHSPVERPHGRLGWSIYNVLGGSYIDLSVMPLSASVPPVGEPREDEDVLALALTIHLIVQGARAQNLSEAETDERIIAKVRKLLPHMLRGTAEPGDRAPSEQEVARFAETLGFHARSHTEDVNKLARDLLRDFANDIWRRAGGPPATPNEEPPK